MKQKADFLKEDLALQKKKLADLKSWGSLQILIDAQTKLVAELEKQVGTEQEAADKGDKHVIEPAISQQEP